MRLARARRLRQRGQALVMFAATLMVAAIAVAFMVDAIPNFDAISRYHKDAVQLAEEAIEWIPTADSGEGAGFVLLTSGPWDCVGTPVTEINRGILLSRGSLTCVPSPPGRPARGNAELVDITFSYRPHNACEGRPAIVAQIQARWAGPILRLWLFRLQPGPVQVTRAFCELP